MRFFSKLYTAGEVLGSALPFLNRSIHPVVIIRAYKRALEDSLKILENISRKVDVENESEMLHLIKSSIGTKFSQNWSELMCKLALKAVRCGTYYA